METKYKQWLRPLFLSLLWLLIGSPVVWGQDWTITPKEGNYPIPVMEQTFYVPAGATREWYVREMYENSTSGMNYYWYRRWYRQGNKDLGNFLVPAINENSLVSADNGKSLFWIKDLEEQVNKERSSNAAVIQYNMPQTNASADVVFCDVSINGDYTFGTSSLIEPTLSVRHKYNILPAQAVAKKEYTIVAPKGATTLNIQMDMLPVDYYWMDSGILKPQIEKNTILKNNSRCFVVEGNNINYEYIEGSRVIVLSFAEEGLQQNLTVKVKTANTKIVENEAVLDTSNPGYSDVFAEFTIVPQENAGFELGSNINENSPDYRIPEKKTLLYQLIGSYDFDHNDVVSTVTVENNVRPTPMNADETTYAYAYPTAAQKTISHKIEPMQNQYGLYRTANKENISSTDISPYTGGPTYDWFIQKDNADITRDIIVYDRTYENSSEGNKKFGYFYYIDASLEPGRIVNVPIDGYICRGTELLITAWINNMTTSDGITLPHINLNIIGYKEDGSSAILHRFTSGDALKGENNAYLGEWQQLCYKCVITQEEFNEYTSFSVEVVNNAKDSGGNDFAIDDIRIYKTLPAIEAFQTDLCNSPTGSIETYLKLRTPYELLLRNLGLEKLEIKDEIIKTHETASAEINEGTEYTHGLHPRHYHMYYTVTYKEHDTWKYLDLDYHNNPTEGNNTPKEKSGIYGTSIISANMDDMLTEMEMKNLAIERHQSIAWLEQEKDGTVYVVFDNIPIHKHKKVTVDGKELDKYYETLELGRDYYIQIFPQAGTSSGRDKPDEPCAIATQFKIHKSLELKYGEVQLEDVTILEPGKEITGVLRYQDSNLEWHIVSGAGFYWYYGPLENGRTSQDIQSILLEGSTVINGNNGLTTKEKEFLKTGSSFKIPSDTPMYQLIVVPTEDYKNKITDPEAKFCIEGRVLTFDPVLDPGDPEVDYPEPDDPDPNTPGDEPTPENPDPDPKDPEDPQPDEDPKNPGRYVRSVRLMLTQIQDMLSSTDNQGTLRIPIHTRVTSVGRTFKVNPSNKDIRLVRTSDEEAHKLNHALEEAGAGIPIATLESLVIPTKDDSQMEGDPAWNTDYFTIKFEPSIINGKSIDKDIEFREGFWYMVEVPFIECPIDYDPSTEGADENTSVYEGSFKLTFKVVPEYVTWKGSEANMHNWNNDGPKHWRRSKNNELYFDGTTTNAEANGNHDEAYTPMRFTKVTVADNGGSAYAAYPYLYKLNPKSGGGESNTELLDMAPAGMPTDIGRATTNIEYDLVADPDWQKILRSTDENDKFTNTSHNYACVRFYGNECDEIYFKPQSAMLHTEYLTYNKAWVDYELDPNRWYTLASPLKGIVAGDMYLPKTARQETAAFADITYNTTNYTRWDPAVYMRGWNKAGEETVVTKEGSGIQYAISGSWSNLYNKVSEPFTAGTGFSIGVKTSEKKALFRLPKADTSYKYYESTDTEQTAGGNEETLNKADADYGKLATDDLKGTSSSGISGGTVNEGSNYQLVGNPFMAHLDMSKFLTSTDGTYYILTENGIESSILGDGFSLTTNADSDPKKVAPLQSFIVSGSTSVTFTPDMMTVPYDNTVITSGLRSATSENEQLPEIRISLEQEGKKNTAVVAYYATATEGYAPNEDALLFIDKEVGTPQIYTVAGNKMTAINVTPELKDLPLGVYSADNTPVTLNFQVSGAMGNVSLYDRETKKSYPLTGGLTITVEGNTSGRYFLRGSVATSNEIVAKKEAICYSGAPGRIDVIHSALLQQVAVYSLSGQRVRFLDNLNTPTLTLDGITPGIYVVRMEGTTGVQTEKVEVK